MTRSVAPSLSSAYRLPNHITGPALIADLLPMLEAQAKERQRESGKRFGKGTPQTEEPISDAGESAAKAAEMVADPSLEIGGGHGKAAGFGSMTRPRPTKRFFKSTAGVSRCARGQCSDIGFGALND